MCLKYLQPCLSVEKVDDAKSYASQCGANCDAQRLIFFGRQHNGHACENQGRSLHLGRLYLLQIEQIDTIQSYGCIPDRWK